DYYCSSYATINTLF
nr:immunoglobulin light chain junction region [Macaca mulatta]MOX79506.1 immunoglobulin light chain junction region [Macaca mulatta]MOX81147.1 immunoglobulin light chain junction region [Macaca mulatta]MOX81809.1 immunoglobulin light chain junction region [Macaca mulatta]MOX82793.1 immunoglobulin light chain junction region [Macaca mulatta]